MPPQITVLQNLGDGKSLVLITNYVNIPTSTASGAYSTTESLGCEVILLGVWSAFGQSWYSHCIVDTIATVKYNAIEYMPPSRFLQKIDTVVVYVFQTDTIARTVKRLYAILGIASV